MAAPKKLTWGVRRERGRHWSSFAPARMTVVHLASREVVWMSSDDISREYATALAKSVKAALSANHNDLEAVPHRGDVFESFLAVIEVAEAALTASKVMP